MSVKFLKLVFNHLNKSHSSRRLKVQTEEDAGNHSGLKTKQKKTHAVCVTEISLHLMFSEWLRSSHVGGSKSKCYGRGSLQKAGSKVLT